MANAFLPVFTLLLAIHVDGSASISYLESTPPFVNGVLTACAGQQISLTCSRDDLSISDTLWRASPPVNCTTVVSHGAASGDDCGPFVFEEITRLELATPPPLNSTAVATTAVNMTNATVECRSGNLRMSAPVGTISLCIVAPTPPPVGLMCNTTLRGLSVAWEPVTDTGCAMGGVNYRVTAIRESDMTNVSSLQVTETTAELNNTLGLLPNTSYIISVSAVTMTGGCDGQQATVICGTSIDLPTITPSTPPPTSPTTMSTTVVSSQSTSPPSTTAPPSTTPSTGLSTGAIAAIAVVVIVLVFLAIVIVIVVVIILMISPKGKKNDRGGVHAPLATDPEHDSLSGQQQQAPVYAMVDKSKKTSAEQPTYQDPATIQHETAESGDLYAVSEKKGKAAKADVAAELYSEVDKSNRSEGGLTYASIEVEAKKKPTQKETEVLYSDIQH